MLYKIGRFLQFLGLLLLPVGIAGNVARPEDVSLGMSLMISGVGMTIFVLGHLIQQRAGPS